MQLILVNDAWPTSSVSANLHAYPDAGAQCFYVDEITFAHY